MDADDLIQYERGKNGQVNWGNKHSVRGWQEAQINAPVFGADPSRAQGVVPPRTKRILQVVALTLLIAFVLIVWIGRTRQPAEVSATPAPASAPNPTSIAWRNGTDISSSTLKLMALPAVTQLIQQPYRRATVDLDGDGRPETIVQTNDCPASACETLIVQTRGATARLVSTQRLPRDLAVTSAVQDGFRVLGPTAAAR